MAGYVIISLALNKFRFVLNLISTGCPWSCSQADLSQESLMSLAFSSTPKKVLYELTAPHWGVVWCQCAKTICDCFLLFYPSHPKACVCKLRHSPAAKNLIMIAFFTRSWWSKMGVFSTLQKASWYDALSPLKSRALSWWSVPVNTTGKGTHLNGLQKGFEFVITESFLK